MKRAYADIPGGQIHYRYAGRGEAVIFLHNAAGHSQEYEAVGNLLAKEFAVYAIDLPGHGASSAPARTYYLQDFAGSVIAFMDALSLQKAIIFGSTAGANVAAHVASKHPDRVKSVILAQLSFNDKTNEPHAEILAPPQKYDGTHLIEYWKRIYHTASPRINHIQVAGYCHAGNLCESMRQAIGKDENIAGTLSRLNTPTLVLKYSAAPGAEAQDAVAKLIPGAKFSVLANASPCVAMEFPDLLAGAVTAYGKENL